MAYFGGLRHAELLSLNLENITRGDEGLTITHARCKPKTNNRVGRFVVPSRGTIDYSELVSKYIKILNSELGIFSGRCFYKGTQKAFFHQPIGKNVMSKVPSEMASLLKKISPETFTFRSLRLASPTAPVGDDEASD